MGNQFFKHTPAPAADSHLFYTANTNLFAKSGIRLEKALILAENAISLRILKKQFEYWNIKADTYQQANLAFTALDQSPYDLVLIELDMPVTSGVEIALQIRSGGANSKLPLILMATPDSAQALSKTERALFSAIVPLPLNHANLRSTINGLFGSNISGPARPIVASKDTRPLNILVAEDNLMTQMLIKKVLTDLGYQPDLVENGVEAVNACQLKHYHIVLMDMQMPEMDGMEAATLINFNKAEPPVIIALTASNTIEDRQLCLGAGMEDFMQKPFSLNDIKQKLEKWKVVIGERVPVPID